ncbi:MAG: LysR family transcriptional regulator [Oscillospiraceae bacterium]|nr:LysR family transcriptional regulator [Oscillospiraceae bacterium]
MNFQSAIYFLAVATEGSIKQAAATLIMSPQALSESIKRMEQELGVSLLNNTRPVTLTPAGKRVAQYCSDLVRLSKTLEHDLANLTDKKGSLKISLPPKGCPPDIMRIIAAFLSHEQNCFIDLSYRPVDATRDDLEKYDLHIYEVPVRADMESVSLPGEPPVPENRCYGIAVRRSLLRRRWGEGWEEKFQLLCREDNLPLLRDIPFITFENSEAKENKEKQLLYSMGFDPLVVASSESIDACMVMCLYGIGGLVAPEDWIRNQLLVHRTENAEDIEIIHLNKPVRSVKIKLCYLKGKNLSKAARQFIQFASSYE